MSNYSLFPRFNARLGEDDTRRDWMYFEKKAVDAKNRPYTVCNSTVYATPTNFSTVSHLDLDRFSFAVELTSQQNVFFTAMALDDHKKKRLRDIYSLDQSLTEHSKGWVNYDVEKLYFCNLKRFVRYERVNYSLLLLLRKWDADRLLKFLEYFLADEYLDVVAFFKLTNIVMQQCQDSGVILQYYRRISSNDTGRDSLVSDVFSCMEHFVIHAHRANFDPLPFLNDLFRTKETSFMCSPLLTAVLKRRSEDLRKYLNRLLEIRSPFMVSLLGTEDTSGDTWWPLLGTRGAPQTYFLSFEFMKRLIHDLLKAVYYVRSDEEDIKERVRMVWRCIPTPFVPLTDMQDYFQLTSVAFEFWGNVIEKYPTDCIADYQPRSLQHLSRCCIRQSLNSIAAISASSLPPSLQDYVTLLC